MFGAIVLVGLEWLVVTLFDSPYLLTATSVVCQIGRITLMLYFITSYFKISFLDLIPIKLILNITIPALCIVFLLKIILQDYFNLPNLLILTIAVFCYCLLFSNWVYYKKIDYFSIIAPLYKKIKR